MTRRKLSGRDGSGIRNPGRRGEGPMVAGLFRPTQHQPGTIVRFADGKRFRVGHREPVQGSAFRTQWVGHELRAIAP